MRRATKWMVGTVVLVGSVGVAAAGLEAVGYDFWRYSDYQHQLEVNEAHTQELDDLLETSEQRLSVKEIVVGDFLNHRATFAQVVDQFHRLNETDDRIAHLIRANYPSADDREAAARNAFSFIDASLSRTAPERPVILGRLRSEFDRLFPRSAALTN